MTPHEIAEPVFGEPWQAHAFGLAVALHERGVFSWPEWAEALAAEIAAAQQRGDPDLGDTYYAHWLGALERIATAKGVGSPADLQRYRDAWHHAADRTPHGQPIDLRADDFGR